MVPIFVFLFFIFGLVIGSFLNVVIYRFNTRRITKGRSACMACANTLLWYELVPLLSFIFLRGRCKSCKTKISLIYPIVELFTGLIFVGLFLKFQDYLLLNPLIFSITYLYYTVAFSVLVVIFVYDLKHKIIPDILSIILGIFAFIGLFFFDQYGFTIHTPTLLEFLAGPLLALPFAFFWLISKGRWMGLGDAKLTIGLGWLLGISRGLSGLVISFWSGALIGILLIFFSRKYKMKSEIPFAPFLILGALLAFFFNIYLFPIL